jgi:hypothetical protein
MTSKEFFLWLGGFVDAVDGIPTQTQWDIIKDKMNEVAEPITWPFGTPNTAPIQTLPFIQPGPSNDPYDRFKTWCGTNGTDGESRVVTTDSIVTDGFIQDSSVTRAQPPFTLTTTSTTYGYPSGSNVSYTVRDK